MKISDFKRASGALSKTIHAFSLCFDKSEINDANVSYDGSFFSLRLQCYVEDFGVSHLSVSSTSEDANGAIEEFYNSLISKIDSNLSELKEEDKKDEKDWEEWRIYNHEYSNLPRIASLEMLKDIILGFKK